jgi:hypothetical protein
MTTKSKSIAVAVTFAVLIIAAWAGSGMLWKMFLRMHGMH